MAVSQQARQDAFLQVDEQGLHAITHDPGPRSPKIGGSKDFSGLDNWSPEITAKRRSLSGSNMSTNSPNKPFDASGSTKIRAKDLEDDEVNSDKAKTPEKRSFDSDTDLPVSNGESVDSPENRRFTDSGTIVYEPNAVEEKIEQKIGRADSPDKVGKFELQNPQPIINPEQVSQIQPLEGLALENKAVNHS